MKNALLTILLLLLTSAASSSEIKNSSLNLIAEKASHVVLGAVVKVDRSNNTDLITLEVRSSLKGNVSETKISFSLSPRGVKDFDPLLKVGDSVVAFLTFKDGKYKRAYWGSIATFTKGNFN